MSRTTRPLHLAIALSLTAALGACGPLEDDAQDAQQTQHVNNLNHTTRGSALHVPAQAFSPHLPESLHLFDALTSAPADPGYGGDGECVMSFALDGRLTDTTLSWAYNAQGLRTHVKLTHDGVTRGITYAYTTDPTRGDEVIEVQAETTLPYTDPWRMRPVYNADHQLIEAQALDISGQPTGESLQISHDAQGRPELVTSTLTFDAFGRGTRALGFARTYTPSGDIFGPGGLLHQWDERGRMTHSASVKIGHNAAGQCTISSTRMPFAGQCDAQGRLTSNIDLGRHTRVTYDGPQLATITAQWRDQEQPRTITMSFSGTRCWMPQHVLLTIIADQQPITSDRLDADRVENIAALLVEPHLTSL